MKSRVLFTGNGELAIEDLMSHVATTYQSQKCPPIQTRFMQALEEFSPHVLVVCLTDETSKMLHMYTELEKYTQYLQLPVIAIGNEAVCNSFYNNVFLTNMKILERPLNIDGFKMALEKYTNLSLAFEKEKKAKEEAEAEEKRSQEVRAAEKKLVKKVDALTSEQGRKIILVVDDDVRMLNVIKLYLEELYEIILVPSGKLALKYLAKKKADLVLLDYMMPEEDGPAVLKKIREESAAPDVPVIFLTGVSEKEQVLRGLELLPNGYILKPVSRELLLEKVTEVILELS